MNEESGESTEEKVIGTGIGESLLEKLVWGWRRDKQSWFHWQGEAYRKERSVIHSKDDVGGRARVTRWRASAASRLRGCYWDMGPCTLHHSPGYHFWWTLSLQHLDAKLQWTGYIKIGSCTNICSLLPAITQTSLDRHTCQRHHQSLARWLEVGLGG